MKNKILPIDKKGIALNFLKPGECFVLANRLYLKCAPMFNQFDPSGDIFVVELETGSLDKVLKDIEVFPIDLEFSLRKEKA